MRRRPGTWVPRGPGSSAEGPRRRASGEPDRGAGRARRRRGPPEAAGWRATWSPARFPPWPGRRSPRWRTPPLRRRGARWTMPARPPRSARDDASSPEPSGRVSGSLPRRAARPHLPRRAPRRPPEAVRGRRARRPLQPARSCRVVAYHPAAVERTAPRPYCPAPMKARVVVTLKRSVLDPQGQAVGRALSSLGFGQVQGVRLGKIIELDLDEKDPRRARDRLTSMCEKLLANTVIEEYRIEEPA